MYLYIKILNYFTIVKEVQMEDKNNYIWWVEEEEGGNYSSKWVKKIKDNIFVS